MNYAEKVQFLKSYQRNKQLVETYEIEIRDLRQSVFPSGYHLSDMPKHQNYEDQMAEYAGEFWEIQRRLERAQAKTLHVLAVINQLDTIDPLGHRLLVERYVNGEKTDYICIKCDVSRQTEWRHRKKAIERLKI